MNTPHSSDFESSKLNVLRMRESGPAMAKGKQREKRQYSEIFRSNPTDCRILHGLQVVMIYR